MEAFTTLVVLRARHGVFRISTVRTVPPVQLSGSGQGFSKARKWPVSHWGLLRGLPLKNLESVKN